MATSGLQRGHNQGILQGVKSGHAMGQLRPGFGSGFTDGTAYPDKLQDPVQLTGRKKPLIYCNADNVTTNTGIVITLTDLIGSGFTLTNAQGSGFTPDITTRNIFNSRNSLDFNDSRCSLYPTPALNFSGDSEISLMMVVNLKAIANQIFYISNNITPGGIDLSTSDTSRTIRSIYYGGQPGSITNSQYDTFASQVERQDWMILTAKYQLNLSQGVGSEQEVYINGTLKKQLFTSNFNIVTTAMTAAQTFIVGNTSTTSGTRGAGIHLGAFLLFDYWINESEQLRLENYFRDYYGHKF
jgi:hypothetical protein